MGKTSVKTYRLTDNRSGESFMLKTGKKGNLTVFDEEFKREDGGKGARRAIRHCPNQKSIFMDEQDKHSLVQPIIFINGYLDVPNNQPITQAFLDAHPSNTANNGGWFEHVNEEQEAKEAIEDEELRMDVMYAVRQTAKKKDGIHPLRAVVTVLTGSYQDTIAMGVEELKNILYNEIEADISRFVDENNNVTIFDDDNVTRKYIILRAIREGIIKKSADGKSILWSKGSKVIATAPKSVDTIQYFADYLTTEDGILVAEEIAKRS